MNAQTKTATSNTTIDKTLKNALNHMNSSFDELILVQNELKTVLAKNPFLKFNKICRRRRNF